MEIPLAPEALYTERSYNEHRSRVRRRPDGKHLPEGVTDVECTNTCWERGGDRSRESDPNCEKALARLRRYHALA